MERLIEKKLKELICDKFNSVKEFSSVINLPYTTVDSILRRGVETANIVNIIKICDALNLNTDSLAAGKIEPKRVFSTEEISSSESEHIKKYRALDEHGKEMVDSALGIEYKRVQQAQEAAESDDDNIVDMMQFLTPVSAGTGEIIYSTSAVGNLSVVSNSYTRKADFCVTVKGNSMEPRFYDGDIVLVQEREDIEYGDIGIFVMGGQSYIKQKGEGKLISLNKNIPDVILGPYDEVICQGKVIGVLDPDWIVK